MGDPELPRDLSAYSTQTECSHGTTNLIHVHCVTCTHCTDDDYPWPLSRNCLHVAFLVFFVVFLVVGVALTVLGFLDYGDGGPTTRAFRILGVVALLLCIGFLIAACVILSECITSSIERDVDGNSRGHYEALHASQSTTLSASASYHKSLDGTSVTGEDDTVVLSNLSHSISYPLYACPNCSCQYIRQSLPRIAEEAEPQSEGSKLVDV